MRAIMPHSCCIEVVRQHTATHSHEHILSCDAFQVAQQQVTTDGKHTSYVDIINGTTKSASRVAAEGVL